MNGMKSRFDFRPGSYRFEIPYMAEDTAALYYSTLNGYEEIGRNYYLDRSDMNNVLLSMTLKGTAHVACPAGEADLRAGSLAFVDCRERHVFYPTCDDWHILFVHISGADVFSVRQKFLEAFGVVCEDFPVNTFTSFLETLFRLEHARDRDPCEMSAVLYGLLMKVLAHAKQRMRGGPFYVKRAERFIHENYARGIGVDGVACAVGVSKFHLSREFHRCTGITIARAIADVRFERSRALLADGSMSVAQVAEAVGFGSLQAMFRMYRERLDTTPSDYRTYIDHV